MKSFKNITTIGLAVLMLIYLTIGNAFAQESSNESASFSAKGVITQPTSITLTAPMGGQIDNFDWLAGDQVSKNDLAFLLQPYQVTAANTGIVTGLHARVGDVVENIMTQYGALCYIERQDIWHIQASITDSSRNVENKDVRLGQNLRVQYGTGDSKVRGYGVVIALDGNNFILEIEQGDFEFDDDVKIYLGDSKDNDSADQIGTGTIIRSNALPVLGEGIVASVLVNNGDKVKRGQALFILDASNSHYNDDQEITPKLYFGQDSVIANIFIVPGQFVAQGQALMSILPVNNLEAIIEVDELDISKVRIGSSVRISIDAFSEERIGIVRDIQPIGQVVLDTTKFLVNVSFDNSDDLMIGMHVQAYWNLY